MGNILGAGLVAFLVAIALGVLLQSAQAKRNAYLGAAVIYLLVGWVNTGKFQEGMQNGLYLYLFLFVCPAQFGAMLGRRSLRKKQAKAEALNK